MSIAAARARLVDALQLKETSRRICSGDSVAEPSVPPSGDLLSIMSSAIIEKLEKLRQEKLRQQKAKNKELWMTKARHAEE